MENSNYSAVEVQQAILNILEDFNDEKKLLESSQKATLNILYDFSSDKILTENSQIALLNILEDFNEEKDSLGFTQQAMLNILDDASQEKTLLEQMQKAVFNILEDYSYEIDRIELMNNKLRDFSEKLEEKVEERTAELTRTNEELESFSYSISHDLRAPLRAISGYSEILYSEYQGKFDEDGNEALEFVIKNAHKMATLIDDILTISRMGRQNLHVQYIDLESYFTYVYQTIVTEKEQEKIRLTIHSLEGVYGDKTMIEQLITNLLSNAVKYSRKSEVSIIEIGMFQKESQKVYYIKDNGVGFNMRYADKLFGLFQRLHKASEFEGTGVGLAISKRVVKHHAGDIWAESEIGKGSTFFFTLNLTGEN